MLALEEGLESLIILLHLAGKCLGGFTEADRVGEHVAQRIHAAQVFAQDLTVLHAHGQSGGFRFYEGVAVAVAAGPGTEAQVTGDGDIRRRLFTVDPDQGPFHLAIGGGDGIEQAFTEVVEVVGDLVPYLRALDPDLIGLPEDVYLVLQLRDDLLSLFLAQSVVIQRLRGDEDAAQGLHHGAAARLGWVGGEYRHIGQ